MIDYTKLLPSHVEKLIGENDLFLEVFEGIGPSKDTGHRPPLLFVHGAYTGSWMWSKYLPHFYSNGWKCYAMNLRSHYKSRVVDMTKITFEDYLEDIREIITVIKTESGMEPVIIGFSLGGILCQKIAEQEDLKGLVLVDSCICKDVYDLVPYESLQENNLGLVMPAPIRDENFSIDEVEEDIEFQRKYLSMESSKALLTCACWIKGISGMTIENNRTTAPTLVIRAVNSELDDRRGRAEADYFHAAYTGLWNTTHTGLLIGRRYQEAVSRILDWLLENSD